MAFENTEQILLEKGIVHRHLQFDRPFESTQDAADMIGVPVEQIAKTLVFGSATGAVVIIASGTARVDNKKFKEEFGYRPVMLSADDLKRLTGFEPGCVSPVGIVSRRIRLYMDVSLKNRGNVYPSDGTDRGAFEIMPDALYVAADCLKTVDVCK